MWCWTPEMPPSELNIHSLSRWEYWWMIALRWVPLQALPLAKETCLDPGYALLLEAVCLQWLVKSIKSVCGEVCGIKWAPLLHPGITLKSHPISGAPCVMGWSLCYNYTAIQLLSLPHPASFTPHRRWSWADTPGNLLCAYLLVWVCFLRTLQFRCL